jgi:hypothetical protein
MSLSGSLRDRLGFPGYKGRMMRVVAVHTEAIEFFAFPIPDALAVDAGLPVFKNSTMTLAA